MGVTFNASCVRRSFILKAKHSDVNDNCQIRNLIERTLESRGQKKKLANNLGVRCFLSFVGAFDVYEIVNSLSKRNVL